MRQKHLSLIAATSMTVAGMGFISTTNIYGADPAADAQPAAQRDPANAQSAEQIVADWPEVAKKSAMETIKKHGEPGGINEDRLVWENKGPYKTIIAYKHQVPHHFPVKHFDTLEHVIDYMVPSDKFDELAMFDGSLIVERTKGTMAARCDSEAHNLIALNLAHDIVTGEKSVEQAKQDYAQLAMALKKGEKPADTQKLTFEVPKDAGDPGEPWKSQSAGKDANPDEAAARGDQNANPALVGVVTVVPIVATDPALPKGATFGRTISHAGAMRDTLASITEAAFTRGGFNDVVERLVDMDRNRIGNDDLNENDLETLDGRVAQLRKAWETKYGQDFDISENRVYAPLAFAQGRITDPAAFASEWPVNATAMKPGDDVQTAAGAVVTDRVEDQANIDEGREIAVVRVPAELGMPALNVSMIDEAFGWKVDAPNTLSGRALHDNLLKHLTYMGENVDKWPADVNDAYRAATQHVLMAVYGVDVPRGNGAAN